MLAWAEAKLLFSLSNDVTGFFSLIWFLIIFSCTLTLFDFLLHTFLPFSLLLPVLLQLGLWSRQCLRLSLRGTPLSCTATWLATQLRRSSGGTPRSTGLTHSSSYGTEPASAGYPSTQPMAPMGSVCWASHDSHWRTLGPMSVGPATTPDAMTSDKTLPSPGSVPRPPFRSYRVSGLCPVVPRWWSTSYPSQPLQFPSRPLTYYWSGKMKINRVI